MRKWSGLFAGLCFAAVLHAGGPEVTETAEEIQISTGLLKAAIRKQGYVSGVAGGSFVDKKTGFHDAGFGLDIVDWLMEPGSDESYRANLDPELVYQFRNLVHGNVPKRSIEGPQICTKAKRLSPRIIRGKDYVAIESSFRYYLAAPGKNKGSEWRQTLVFPEGKRYFFSSDRVTSVNSSDGMFLRVDMPGHIRHKDGDTFSEVYLSYAGRIPARNFLTDFAPDAKYRYVRNDREIPRRFIRAYRLRDLKTGAPGPWLAAMTLEPSVVSEAWCHQRGYVSMIEEFGGRPIRPGQSFSAAFLIGYFDSIAEMEQTYDKFAGFTGIQADEHGWRLLNAAGGMPEAARDPARERLARRLEWFRDLKFGFFMHWGAYSQMGCIESWPLVWADRKWSNPAISTREEMVAFRKKYWALNRTFNPARFDPKAWAAVAKRAGMKYVVFTTKHHDGFSMFDTKLTDYRVTAKEVPFSRDPRSNIAAEVFRAFRAEGFGIGAYFSKPDWHSPDYWDPARFAEDRNPNYDTAAEPERWARFVEFVHGQVKELMTGYGPVDILWLDGGQVRPPKQDIQMDRLVAMARSHQPDLIVVNRAAHDRYEDYRTPEQEVPPQALPYTWESCITMGTQWSYKPDDRYKPARDLIRLLVDVVAKGGNLLLNVGPRPDGTLPGEAVARLEEIGKWMAVNGEAIYGTREIAPYQEGHFRFTRKANHVYAIYLPEAEEKSLPERLMLRAFHPAPGSRVEMLGAAQPVEWQMAGEGVELKIPAGEKRAANPPYALVFRLRTEAAD